MKNQCGTLYQQNVSSATLRQLLHLLLSSPKNYPETLNDSLPDEKTSKFAKNIEKFLRSICMSFIHGWYYF